MYYLYEDSLQHSGVKGMHWGVRKYRNYDGTLTAAGKARYGVGDGSSSGGSGKISRREARRQKKVESVRQLSKEAKKATQEAREALEELRRERSKSAEEQRIQNEADQKDRIASTRLSNEEMRATIERLKLEREYNELVNPAKKPEPTTMEKLKKFAQDATPIIAAGAAAVKLYQQIKGKDGDDNKQNNNQNNNSKNNSGNNQNSNSQSNSGNNNKNNGQSSGNPQMKNSNITSGNSGSTQTMNTSPKAGASKQYDYRSAIFGSTGSSSAGRYRSYSTDSYSFKWADSKKNEPASKYTSKPMTQERYNTIKNSFAKNTSRDTRNYEQKYRETKNAYDAAFREKRSAQTATEQKERRKRQGFFGYYGSYMNPGGSW